MGEAKDKNNYLLYVSDMDVLPGTGHFRKMDATRTIAEHICNNMNNTILIPYTDYNGEILDACSVGIVFPTHTWGVSLAVYTFLQHLRISDNTYVYAVAIGESLSEAVDATLINRLKNMEQFNRMFTKHGLGTNEDIYVRCIDKRRMTICVEEELQLCSDIRESVNHIMRGLLFHNMNELSEGCQDEGCDVYNISRNRAFDYDKRHERELLDVSDEAHNNRKKVMDTRIVLENVFLNDEWLSGVKLCQVM